VGDTAAAVERAVESGGSALRGPFEVPRGRMAAMQDPARAIFSICDTPAPSPSDAWWLELSTPDVAAAEAFYARLLNWSFDDTATIRAPAGQIGRMRGVEAAPGWSPCLRVADIEEARRRAEAAGARRVGDTQDDPAGRIAAIVDPQGASLSLLEQA
jgi:uncharacterized protein